MFKSITSRLAWIYSGLTIGVLILISFIIYFSLTNMAIQSSRQFLSDELDYFQTTIKAQNGNLLLLQHEINWIPTPVEVQDQEKIKWILPYDYIRVLDGTQLLQKTPGMNNILPRGVFPKVTQGNHSPIKQYTSEEGRQFLLIAGQVQLDNKDHRTIQIGLDITTVVNMLSYYRHLLMIVIVILSLIIGASAAFIANKALQPLHAVSKRARKISVQDLSLRLIPESWPRELQELIGSLNEMLTRIDTSYQRLNRFSAELAHELRTPLNNLMGEAQVTLSKPREIDEYRQLLVSSLEEYQRLNQLIEQMLLLAKLENPKSRIAIEEIDAADSINTVLQYFEFILEDKNIQVDCHVNGKIKVNKILWQRAISNLIDNAIKYTPEGGKIKISGGPKNNSFEMTIHDSGIGIKANDLPLLYERFYRVGNNNEPGFGLGLSITASIIKHHQGDIQIRSEPEQGTEVKVFVPFVAR